MDYGIQDLSKIVCKLEGCEGNSIQLTTLGFAERISIGVKKSRGSAFLINKLETKMTERIKLMKVLYIEYSVLNKYIRHYVKLFAKF